MLPAKKVGVQDGIGQLGRMELDWTGPAMYVDRYLFEVWAVHGYTSRRYFEVLMKRAQTLKPNV